MTFRPPFEEVVVEHGGAVLAMCRALLGPADADDAWSETFLAAMRAYPRLRPDSNVRAWLVTIAHHKAIDQIRARDRRPRPTGAVPDVPTCPDQSRADTDALRPALEGLPAGQREAVVYRYLADLSYAEISRLLGCSEQAARRRVSDGLANLRSHHSRGAIR